MAADDRDGPDDPKTSVDKPEPQAEPEPESEAEPEPPSVPPEPVVEALDLSHEVTAGHRFRLRRSTSIRVLGDVSFTITAGEAVGCLGVQGAGKSTLLKLVTGILGATGGTVRTFGRPPLTTPDELAARVGVVFADRPQLWPDLSLTQSLRVLAASRRLPERRWLPRRNELVDQLELGAFLEVPVQQLSAGRRRCAEAVAALLHEPDLVVLDQPTRGLDVRSKARLRSLLRHEHRVHGRTVLISSAELGDVEQFCDRILVLDHGRLAYDGDVAGLISRAGSDRILVVDLSEPDRLLDDVPGTSLIAVEAEGLRQRLSFGPGEVSTASVLAEVTGRVGVRDLTLEDAKLEDVVRRLRFRPDQA